VTFCFVLKTNVKYFIRAILSLFNATMKQWFTISTESSNF